MDVRGDGRSAYRAAREASRDRPARRPRRAGWTGCRILRPGPQRRPVPPRTPPHRARSNERSPDASAAGRSVEARRDRRPRGGRSRRRRWPRGCSRRSPRARRLRPRRAPASSPASAARRRRRRPTPCRRLRRPCRRRARPDAHAPTPTPAPTPVLVPAPLTGRLVAPAAAARHPIAVMIDDLSPARPQSGFTAASVVWQAPAEGGIPRYMMVFQENIPTDVGPVRSSRYYYIAWAAELQGGLRPRRRLAAGARHAPREGPRPARLQRRRVPLGRLVPPDRRPRFAPAQPVHDGQPAPAAGRDGRGQGRHDQVAVDVRPRRATRQRPVGGRILANYSRQRTSATTTTGRRTPTSDRSRARRSRSTRPRSKRVAPKNVIVMLMHFGPLNDGSQEAPPRGAR